MLVSNSSEHLVNWSPHTLVKSMANLLVLRGDKVYDERQSLEADVFKGGSVTGVRDSHRLFGNQKSVGLLSNNQSHVPQLERILRRGTAMRLEQAYLHHYSKYGVGADFFDEAFLACESALSEYKSL